MQVDSPARLRNIAIAGHNDTGKTTLVQRAPVYRGHGPQTFQDRGRQHDHRFRPRGGRTRNLDRARRLSICRGASTRSICSTLPATESSSPRPAPRCGIPYAAVVGRRRRRRGGRRRRRSADASATRCIICSATRSTATGRLGALSRESAGDFRAPGPAGAAPDRYRERLRRRDRPGGTQGLPFRARRQREGKKEAIPEDLAAEAAERRAPD